MPQQIVFVNSVFVFRCTLRVPLLCGCAICARFITTRTRYVERLFETFRWQNGDRVSQLTEIVTLNAVAYRRRVNLKPLKMREERLFLSDFIEIEISEFL